MEIFFLKPLVVGKISLFSGMYNDALMHREGLKGYIRLISGYKHDALKHHFTSLKTALIFLQLRVLERKFP